MSPSSARAKRSLAVETPVGWLAANAIEPGRVFATVEDSAGALRTVTYAEELDRVRRTATVLSELGVGSGDRVHLHLGNCLEFYDLWFATGLIGAVMVPTNPLSTADEVVHVLDDAAPVLSVTQTALLDTVRAAAATSYRAVRVMAIEGAGQDTLATRTRTTAASVGRDVGATAAETAAILYTSGTTSRPKGVLVTHANYVQVGLAVASHLEVTAEDRWLIVLPLFHANAQYYCTMSALVTGASLALAPKFSASRWGEQAVRHHATLASLFAAPIRMILASPPQHGEHREQLRAVLFAQNLTDAQAASFEERFGTRLLQLYGMTETVLPPTMNPNTTLRRWNSIGQALPGVQVRVTDAVGQCVPIGTPGELLIRGEPGVTVAAGYLNHPTATAETFHDGWLHTGDLAHVDQEGFFYFVDRAKDMIKRGGENVAASEIERVVNEHPEVFECAAVGIPDSIRDEAILVYVVGNEPVTISEGDLFAWCRARLAKFKVPSKFVFTDALPRTSVGKIRKQALRTDGPPPSATASATAPAVLPSDNV